MYVNSSYVNHRECLAKSGQYYLVGILADLRPKQVTVKNADSLDTST